MPSDFEALVATVREHSNAHEWLHETSAFSRDALATIAAKKYGTTPLDFRKDPRLIRDVETALLYPPPVVVVLGENKCAYCDRELVDDDCPDDSCEANNRTRRERPFSRRYG